MERPEYRQVVKHNAGRLGIWLNDISEDTLPANYPGRYSTEVPDRPAGERADINIYNAELDTQDEADPLVRIETRRRHDYSINKDVHLEDPDYEALAIAVDYFVDEFWEPNP